MDTYYDVLAPEDAYSNPQNAALYVAVMLAGSAILLTLMKKSGFRAMVAVGGS